MKNCCNASNKSKKCFRKSDKKIFSLPRRFSRKKCLTDKIKGFTMRSSCAPYKNCKKIKGGARNYGTRSPSTVASPAPPARNMNDIAEHDIKETELGGLLDLFIRSYRSLPTTGQRSVSPNTFNDMANDITNIINDIYVIRSVSPNEFIDVTPYYLINGLFKLTRSAREIDAALQLIPALRRSDFISEMNRIRNALITALEHTGYPMETLRQEPFFLNIDRDIYNIDTSLMPHARFRIREIEDDTSIPLGDLTNDTSDSLTYSTTNDESVFDEMSVNSPSIIPDDNSSIHDLDENMDDTSFELDLEGGQYHKKKTNRRTKRKRTNKRRRNQTQKRLRKRIQKHKHSKK